MPRHVIVDGSNLATEGRAMPSLKQLIDAVQSFIEENPTDLITVVVDATFGHRIDPKEVADFEAAIEHNEMVAPPAGAVGRGDAFVLAIAKKVNATILSNDSFQEFHGEQLWLFDEGRLIGGKPVPHIGWVFVPRVPVRGPLSRKVQREARGRGSNRDQSVVTSGGRGRGAASAEPIAVIGSKEASKPMPVPKAPPPNVRRGGPAPDGAAAKSGDRQSSENKPATQSSVPARGAMVNDLLPFLSFVETHPVGSTVEVTVDSYSSHGAYGHVGGATVYLPLRNIADPAPRSARDAVQIGDTVPMVVAGLHAAKRGIDVAMPSMAATVAPVALPVPAKLAKRGSKKSGPDAMIGAESPVPEVPAGTAGKKAALPQRGRSSKSSPTTVTAAEQTSHELSAYGEPPAQAAVAQPKAGRGSSRKAASESIDEESPSARARSRRSPRLASPGPVAPAGGGSSVDVAAVVVAADVEPTVGKAEAVQTVRSSKQRQASAGKAALTSGAAASIKAKVGNKAGGPTSRSAAAKPPASLPVLPAVEVPTMAAPSNSSDAPVESGGAPATTAPKAVGSRKAAAKSAKTSVPAAAPQAKAKAPSARAKSESAPQPEATAPRTAKRARPAKKG